MHYLSSLSYLMTEPFGTLGLLARYGPPWAEHGGGGGWGPWILAPFLFWIALILLIALVVRKLFPGRGRGDGPAPRDPAEEILRERFARGEISTEEYERSLEILRRERDPG